MTTSGGIFPDVEEEANNDGGGVFSNVEKDANDGVGSCVFSYVEEEPNDGNVVFLDVEERQQTATLSSLMSSGVLSMG